MFCLLQRVKRGGQIPPLPQSEQVFNILVQIRLKQCFFTRQTKIISLFLTVSSSKMTNLLLTITICSHTFHPFLERKHF